MDSIISECSREASEAITPTLEVTNPGTVIGGESISLYVDGEEADTRFVRVPGGNEEQVDFAFKPGEPGTYEVAVGLSPEDLIATETVEVTPTSAEFEWLSFDGFDVPKKSNGEQRSRSRAQSPILATERPRRS